MIKNVVIIGMGALGLLFGQRIHTALGDENFCFVMDDERARKHREDIYTINGEGVTFPILSSSEYLCSKRPSPDLIIVATKYSGLYQAREMAKELMDNDTTVISILNGISSEDILAEEIPRKQIIDCIALGMDAVREGTHLTYKNVGMLRVGLNERESQQDRHDGMDSQQHRLDALKAFFEETEIPYEIRDDIRRDMWNKLMMNVGINQTCMVYEANYGEALHTSPAKEDLYSAMHEVIEVANLEGVNLTEDDFRWNIDVFETLNPEGLPSMRQDAIAKRPSEVELFAGTIIKYANKHGVAVPTNEKYYALIKEMESKY